MVRPTLDHGLKRIRDRMVILIKSHKSCVKAERLKKLCPDKTAALSAQGQGFFVRVGHDHLTHQADALTEGEIPADFSRTFLTRSELARADIRVTDDSQRSDVVLGRQRTDDSEKLKG